MENVVTFQCPIITRNTMPEDIHTILLRSIYLFNFLQIKVGIRSKLVSLVNINSESQSTNTQQLLISFHLQFHSKNLTDFTLLDLLIINKTTSNQPPTNIVTHSTDSTLLSMHSVFVSIHSN